MNEAIMAAGSLGPGVHDSDHSDSTQEPEPFQPTESFKNQLAVVRKNKEKKINDTEASNQSKLNPPPSVDPARELNIQLAEEHPSVSKPPPAEELGIDEPSHASSYHPHALLELSSEVDAFAALQDEDRPDHLDYEEESDVIQDTNELQEENRAYSGINLSHSGVRY